MSVHSTRAARALTALAEQDPALGALSLWCDHRDGETGEVPAQSDRATVVYGPTFERLSAAEQVGLAGHHILHVALRHAPRAGTMARRQGGAFDPDLFALAADAILNETLTRADYALPRPAVLLTDVLRERLGVDSDDALGAWDVERLYLALCDAEAEAESGRGGKDYKPDFAPDGDAGGGTGGDEPGTAADWQQRVAQAMEAGRLAGIGIGTLGARIAPIAEVRTPWETRLRTRLLRATSFQPSRDPLRPGRAWIAMADQARRAGRTEPPMEPGTRRRTRRARIAVGLDMSGSITTRQLNRFASEVAAIARRTGAEVHAITFDAKVRDVAVLDAASAERDIRALPVSRGGGTDFAPVVVEACQRQAEILVVLTDLEGPAGPAPASLPVLWAATGPAPPPAFGEVIRLDL